MGRSWGCRTVGRAVQQRMDRVCGKVVRVRIPSSSITKPPARSRSLESAVMEPSFILLPGYRYGRAPAVCFEAVNLQRSLHYTCTQNGKLLASADCKPSISMLYTLHWMFYLRDSAKGQNGAAQLTTMITRATIGRTCVTCFLDLGHKMIVPPFPRASRPLCTLERCLLNAVLLEHSAHYSDTRQAPTTLPTLQGAV